VGWQRSNGRESPLTSLGIPVIQRCAPTAQMIKSQGFDIEAKPPQTDKSVPRDQTLGGAGKRKAEAKLKPNKSKVKAAQRLLQRV
jgi:hypothetical protein